jgi:zinc protease
VARLGALVRQTRAVATRRTTQDGIICGEVDGVPAFWPPERDGPAAALLMFRVGQADETLPIRGITHMIEHLALVPTGRAPHDFNGQTGSSITSFGVVGQPGELVSFFDVLGLSLRELPIDRLASERTVLQTEEQARAHSSQALWNLRWGPHAHGLMGYDELGLHGLDQASLQHWTDQWFVRQNAALVLNGPPPRGLRLPLGDGYRAAPPEVGPATDPLPAWYPQQPPSFGLSYLRDRTAASAVAAWLLQERLNDALRREHGLVYGVSGASAILSGDIRHDVLWTQALDEKLDQAVMALIAVLSAGAVPMSEAERKAWAAKKREQRRQSVNVPGSTTWAAYLAECNLYGVEASFDEFDQSARGVRETDVLSALEGFSASMLLALPEGSNAGTVAVPIPQESPTRLTGKPPRPAHGQTWTMTVVPEGITATDTGGRAVTVLFNACAAVRAWDDGARQLIGDDGFSVMYRPEQWKNEPTKIAQLIDAAVGEEKVVRLGSRTPLARPSGGAPVSSRAVGDKVLLAIGALFLLGAIIAPYDPGPGDTLAARIFVLLVFAGIGAGFCNSFFRKRWQNRNVRRGVIAAAVLLLVSGLIGFLTVQPPT